jgi:hypothetical protein
MRPIGTSPSEWFGPALLPCRPSKGEPDVRDVGLGERHCGTAPVPAPVLEPTAEQRDRLNE